ncbi:phosphoribosyltransferase [Mucilaginibacter sp.]|uniref:phosphoribosyltransferase n=1 Tax=Mucilaginibacter sp. TaxID=1882438 RepID=UPI002625C746|nr:phosphoribosyltransferase family protein [Mucilaginibacter sp.]MDB4924442.1 phosphoribosyltransferase [Mucilaginibacter sp.]
MQRIFKNRQHAGKELGRWLRPKYRQLNPLVLGIPRGGVAVAYEVALELGAELAVVVAKKLPLPTHPEFGFGAVAEDGSVYVNPEAEQVLPAEMIRDTIREQQEEIRRRVQVYRQGKALPELAGRIVIIVDDGIATGATLVPVLELCRKMNAGQIIIAVPVSGTRYDPRLEKADRMEILHQPEEFNAVGQAYAAFDDFSDREVVALLEKAKKTRSTI